MFESSVIVAYQSLICLRCEKMDLKIIQSLLERIQIHKNAGNQIICDSLTVQDKQGTHEQLSLN